MVKISVAVALFQQCPGIASVSGRSWLFPCFWAWNSEECKNDEVLLTSSNISRVDIWKFTECRVRVLGKGWPAPWGILKIRKWSKTGDPRKSEWPVIFNSLLARITYISSQHEGSFLERDQQSSGNMGNSIKISMKTWQTSSPKVTSYWVRSNT